MRSVILTVFLFFPAALWGQGQQLPTDITLLQSLLSEATTTEDSVNILNELSWQLRQTAPGLAQDYAFQAIIQARKIDYTVGLADAHNRLGTSLHTEGLYLDSALAYFDSCFILRMTLGDTLGALGAKNNMALIYTARNKYEDAVAIYKQIVLISEEIGDLKRMARCKMNLGNVYKHTGEYQLALKSLWESQKIWEDLGDKVEAGKLNLNISNIYERMGQLDEAVKLLRRYLKMCIENDYAYGEAMAYNNIGIIMVKSQEYDSATYYYQQSLRIKKELRDFEGLTSTYQNLAGLYNTGHKNYDSAIVYVQKSLNIHKLRGDSLGIARALNSIGTIQMNSQAYEEALGSFLDAFRIASNYGAPLYKLDLLKNISTTYEYLNDYNQALVYLQRYQALLDTLSFQINEGYQQELELTRLKHQSNILQFQVKQKNIVIGTLGIGLVLVIALLLALLNASKQKRKRLQEEEKRLRSEQESLRRKHEIERLLKDQELKSIGQVLEAQEAERKRIAQDLHDRLGSMLSMVKVHFQNTEESIARLHEYNRQEYESAINLLDEACEEVRKISHNLISGVLKTFGLKAALEELKSALENIGKLKVDLVLHNMDERIDYNKEVNIYRIIQESVNNVLRHAEATYIGIQVIKSKDVLSIMIEDNGVGFDKSKINQMAGIGLKNIESRVAKLGGKLQIDSTLGKGTTIIITTPIQ